MSRPMSDDLLIPGFGIGGYRSFRTLQRFDRLGKVSFLAGRNNVGKSNVIRFLSALDRDPSGDLGWLDDPRPDGEIRRFAVCYQTPTVEGVRDGGKSVSDVVAGDLVEALSNRAFHPTGTPGLWINYVRAAAESHGARGRRWQLDEDQLAAIVDGLTADERRAFSNGSSALKQTSGGRPTEDLGRVLSTLFPFPTLRVEVIQAFRQIAASHEDGPAEEGLAHSGRGLIKRVAALQNPGAQEQNDRKKFDAINAFARSVLEDESVAIEIPSTQDQVLVHHGGLVLPLESLGTGVHQVIILAAAATSLDRCLVCIEEPEIHLHPLMQRRLVEYLAAETTNQYIIATHSAHMLDYENSAIYHLRHGEQGTTVTAAASPQAASDVCVDLGYRPSDLIQTNAIIWVEGPSDRVYLNYWIQRVNNDAALVEGIHYSIMFYGGKLLSHLTANDPTIDEFISLRRLNRNAAILIDSDKTKAHKRINATKRRVRDEFDQQGLPGFAWITAGRTIENYVPEGVLSRAVGDVHPRLAYSAPSSKWENPLQTPDKSYIDKVHVARQAVSHWPEDLPPELVKQVRKVITFVREANGM